MVSCVCILDLGCALISPKIFSLFLSFFLATTCSSQGTSEASDWQPLPYWELTAGGVNLLTLRRGFTLGRVEEWLHYPPESVTRSYL